MHHIRRHGTASAVQLKAEPRAPPRGGWCGIGIAFLSLPFSTCAARPQTSSRFRADNAVCAAVQTATGVLAVDPLPGIIKTSIGITDGPPDSPR